jgi:hypothetical protein
VRRVPGRSALFRVVALVGLALAGVATPARADVTKSQCVDANSNGQALRLQGKLAAARSDLLFCTNPSCPAIVRADCAQRVDELEHAQPTIVFDVKDGHGADRIGVRVSIDAGPSSDPLDGTALRVDPGEHAFTFAVTGEEPQTRRFLIKEGEKGRRERIVIGSAQETPTSVAPQASPTGLPPTPSPPSKGLGSQKILGLTVGGLGIAGLAVGSVFGLLTFSATSAQKNACNSPTDCPNPGQAASDHSSATTDGAASTVAFIAGGALLVTGAALFLTARHGDVTVSAQPMVGRDGAWLSLRGDF